MTNELELTILCERVEQIGRDIRLWLRRQENPCACGHLPIQHTPEGVCLVPGCSGSHGLQCAHRPSDYQGITK